MARTVTELRLGDSTAGTSTNQAVHGCYDENVGLPLSLHYLC